MNSRGFTLIELMVVITIVAILSTIGLIYYGNFLKNSRDAKRQSDLKFIQSALEDYHADNLSYPSQVTPGSPLTSGTKTYMTKVPNDPKASPYPDYSYVPSPTSYCLYAALEGTIPLSDEGCRNNQPADYNYGVTRP